MNCSDVDRLMSEGLSTRELSAIAEAHIQSCPRCGPLLSLLDEPIAVPLDESRAQARIASGLKRNLRPVESAPSVTKLVGFIVALIGGVFLLWMLLMGIPGYKQLDQMRRLALSVYSMVLILLLSISLLRLSRPAAPRPISPTLLLAGVVIGYPWLVSLLFPLQPPQGFLAEDLICLLFGWITALLTGAMIWSFTGRGYARNSILVGAVLGALSGLIGILTLQWICPEKNGAHIALWHGLTGILSIASGASAGYLAHLRSQINSSTK